MADVVEGSGDAAAVEQESRAFELPTEPAPADPVDPTAPAAEDAPSAPAADDGSSSSSDDEGEKTAAASTPIPPSDGLPLAAGSSGGKWNQLFDKIHPSVKKHADTVANHPYVTATANTLRQRASQAQERMHPIVNHPYVQKGTGAIRAGGTRTLETGKKVYNREEGYEPKRLIPFFVATIGLVALGLLIRVLVKRYPEFGGALRMKFKKEEP